MAPQAITTNVVGQSSAPPTLKLVKAGMPNQHAYYSAKHPQEDDPEGDVVDRLSPAPDGEYSPEIADDQNDEALNDLPFDIPYEAYGFPPLLTPFPFPNPRRVATPRASCAKSAGTILIRTLAQRHPREQPLRDDSLRLARLPSCKSTT